MSNNNKIALDLPRDSLKEGKLGANRVGPGNALTAVASLSDNKNNNSNNSSNNNGLHPLHKALINHEHSELKRKYFTMSHVYGSSMPVNFEMEKLLVGQSLRLGGDTLLASHGPRMAMDTLNGNDENIEFEDYLQNGEWNDEHLNHHLDLHTQMEKKMGLEVKMRF